MKTWAFPGGAPEGCKQSGTQGRCSWAPSGGHREGTHQTGGALGEGGRKETRVEGPAAVQVANDGVELGPRWMCF